MDGIFAKKIESNTRRSLAVGALAALAVFAGGHAFANHPFNVPTRFSAVNMVILGPGETNEGPAFGASTLVRDYASNPAHNKGVTGTVHIGDLGTSGLPNDPPGTRVYTVWAIVFNNPGACLRINDDGICSPGEEIPRDGGVASGLSIFWVAGAIASYGVRAGETDPAGVLNVSFRIERNRPPGFVVPAFGQRGLTNIRGSEMHFVSVPHALAEPGDNPAEAPSVAWEITHPGPANRGAVHMAP